MNLFKKIVLFVGLSLTFLLAFQGSEKAVYSLNTETNKPLYSTNTSDNSVFIQPEIVTHIVVNFKIEHQTMLKFFDNYLDLIPNIESSKIVNTFAIQDINRCAKVSLLLFPFHIFW